MSQGIYGQTKRDNEHWVAAINRAWGARVAWVEDQVFFTPSGGQLTLPVIKSNLVGGKLPGVREPAFFPGPAVGI